MSVTVGDDIRFTGESDYFDRSAIYTVTDLVGYGNIIVDNPGGPNGIYYGEYEIITKEVDTMEKAQKGDLVRIVDAQTRKGGYKNGDIVEVLGRWFGGVIIDINSPFNDIYDFEYVIHRKAGEEDSEEASEQWRVSTCDYCETKLGEIACSTHLGGSFCNVKCGDAYVGSVESVKVEQDVVNSPNHYTQGKFETIEIIEEITKGYSDGYVAYCVGNALKYLARAPFKHGEPSEDLSKAAKYLAFASEYLDAKSTQD